MAKKVIAVSGSPGTGKTEIAEILAEEIGASLISIKETIEKEKVKFRWDRRRKSKVIDPKDLQPAVSRSLNEGWNVVEGLLAHLLKWDVLIVLRCNPRVLKKRLEKRKWGEQKVLENVAAEALGVITFEALQRKKKGVYELDTTGLAPRRTAGIIENILKDSNLGKRYLPGKIDWLRNRKLVKML